MSKPRKGDMVLVHWVDSVAPRDHGWSLKKDMSKGLQKPSMMRTAGFVIHWGPKTALIAGSSYHDTASGFMSIPMSAVRKVRRLK